jgi:hypothetical protein
MTKKVKLPFMEAVEMQQLARNEGMDPNLSFSIRLVLWFIENDFLINPDEENGIEVSSEKGAIIFEKVFVETETDKEESNGESE